LLISNYVIVVPEFNLTDTFIFRMMASFGSPLKLSPSSPKRRKETLNWEQCIICQCSNAEPVICMRDVGKDSFVRSMEIRRDEVYSRMEYEIECIALLQSMNVKLCRTFGDLAISFVQSQLSCFHNASSIIDVFDRYDVEQSIKSAERDRRSRTARATKLFQVIEGRSIPD
jgi:hypothetical protein